MQTTAVVRFEERQEAFPDGKAMVQAAANMRLNHPQPVGRGATNSESDDQEVKWSQFRQHRKCKCCRASMVVLDQSRCQPSSAEIG